MRIPPLRFRHRIGLLVALAAVGLVAVTAVTLVLGRRSGVELSGIETRYVPLIELDRDLKTTFAQLTRALKDAADAADEARLVEADALERELVQRLHSGHDMIVDNHGDPVALERELVGYYALARGVTAAVVAGSPIAPMDARIEAMWHAQQLLATHLDAAAAPDRRRLAVAFETARRSQRDALILEILVATGVLAVMVVASWQLIRRTVRSLREVALGVERLARGDFGHEISVATGDEIGDLAREANVTAARLREYRENKLRLLTETQRQAEELGRAHDTVALRNATLVSTQGLLEQRAAELELVSTALRDKNADLENVHQTLSHDLRAPLRSIRGFSQILAELLDGKLDPESADALDRVLRGSERMATMIEGLYQLLRLSAGQATANNVDAAAVLHGVMDSLYSDLQRASATITHDELPVIRGSAMLLGQVFQNLIANAIKFKASDDPSIHVSAVRLADTWQFSVRDNGVGIDPAARDRVFRLFERLDSTGTGAGVGLALCRRAVEKLGGRIWVDPETPTGAAFCFTVPAATPEGELPPDPLTDRAAAPFS